MTVENCMKFLKKLKIELPCVRAQSCLTLCNPMNCSLPGSSVYGFLQANILEWVAISFSRGSSQPKNQTHFSCISCIASGFFTNWATWETQNYHIDPTIPLLGEYLRKTKSLIWKDTCSSMSITALLNANIWKQPKCPSTDERIKKMWHIHTMEHYSSHKKEWNFAICNSIDGLGGYYARWNKSDRKKQILHNITYIKSKKHNKLVNIIKKKQTHRYRQQTSCYHWVQVRRKKPYRCRGLRGMNY